MGLIAADRLWLWLKMTHIYFSHEGYANGLDSTSAMNGIEQRGQCLQGLRLNVTIRAAIPMPSRGKLDFT